MAASILRPDRIEAKYTCFRVLLDKWVIIKYNTHFAKLNVGNRIQVTWHPRIGHVGLVVGLVDYDYALVAFSDGKVEKIPAVQAFFLHDIYRIIQEKDTCEEDVMAAHGGYEYNKICQIYCAAMEDNQKDALLLAFSSAYSDHFITYACCLEEDYPPYIGDQNKWIQKSLLETENRIFMEEQAKINILKEIHAFLMNVPILFREKVCEQCNYSIPTFYRKMRAFKKGDKNNIIPGLSNAEREEILRQAEHLVDELSDFLNNFRRPKK
jgi:hypothetical protein